MFDGVCDFIVGSVPSFGVTRWRMFDEVCDFIAGSVLSFGVNRW